MSKHILKELPELVDAGIIDDNTAAKIREHYQQKVQQSNRLVMVFGILGALLTGLGIILIIAHNWDELSKSVKLLFALFPLLAGQALCGYTLLRKNDNRVWRETCAVFLFFAISSSITIVSQVYHIHGNLARFLMVWIVLSIPVLYIMRSGMVSLLVLCIITWYGCEVSYFDYPRHIAWYYWVMMASIIPFFFLQKMQGRNFFYFHTWFIALSLIIMLGMFIQSDEEVMIIAYMSLFSAFVLLGNVEPFAGGRLAGNAFLITGSMGSTGILLFLTFDVYWSEILTSSFSYYSTEFYTSLITSLVAAALLVYTLREKSVSGTNPKGYIFLAFIVLFFLGRNQPATAQLLTNMVVLVIAVLTVKNGADQDNLVVLNYGLLIITALVLCRFFDTDLSFVFRGILFIAVGLSFFGANYWMMKRRKTRQA